MSYAGNETAAPSAKGNGGKGKASTRKSSPSGITPQARWNTAHPLEMWAHAALRSAIKKGLVERQPCERCGAGLADGHHSDYSRPLDVTWLCRLHHRREHKRLKCEAVT